MEYCLKQRLDYSAPTTDACYFSINSVSTKKFVHNIQIATARRLDTIPLVYFENEHSIIQGDILKMLIFKSRLLITIRQWISPLCMD